MLEKLISKHLPRAKRDASLDIAILVKNPMFSLRIPICN
jgi:hypothetical protein